eukprot:scaffold1039_cov280-Pinguiococcus_pyrenoidosus.AAC.1
MLLMLPMLPCCQCCQCCRCCQMLPMLLLTDDPSRDGTSQSLSSIDAEADLEECRSVMATFGEEDSAPLEDVA